MGVSVLTFNETAARVQFYIKTFVITPLGTNSEGLFRKVLQAKFLEREKKWTAIPRDVFCTAMLFLIINHT